MSKKPSKRKSPVKRNATMRKLTSSKKQPAQSRPKRTGRQRMFVQRYYIDKFERNSDTEWEIFTIEVRGTKKGKPLQTKKKMIAKVKEITR